MTSSKGDHLETEQKYDAAADFVLPKLGKSVPKRIYLSATYFDTEDLDLIHHHITLRRRVGGGDEGWHLKLPVRKDTRQEMHAPLDEGTEGSVPARLAAQVEDITAGHRLRPIAILDTERTVVTVAARTGDASARDRSRGHVLRLRLRGHGPARDGRQDAARSRRQTVRVRLQARPRSRYRLTRAG